MLVVGVCLPIRGLSNGVSLLVAPVKQGTFAEKALFNRTGMKCLPAAKIPQANGVCIHDWHAEILAVRAFNQFLLGECRDLALGMSSHYLRWRDEQERVSGEDTWHGQPFTWKEGVSLHMYCSEAPCMLVRPPYFLQYLFTDLHTELQGGDASMEIIMAAQEDASPWEVPLAADSETPEAGAAPSLMGRGFFSQLGVVRRKPGRADAPPTLSKSCSDKLALRQCTSLLSSITSLLVSPKDVYLESLVLPESQYSAVACDRSFSATGRMRIIAGKHWPGGYSFHPVKVETTSKEFYFSNKEVVARSGGRVAASNLAATWSMEGLDEGLIGGSLEGRKQFHLKGASRASRAKMWENAQEIAGLDDVDTKATICGQLGVSSYQEIKDGRLLEARRKVKEDAYSEALKGWTRNAGDENFSLRGGRSLGVVTIPTIPQGERVL